MARATNSVPRALEQHRLSGEVTVRLTLDQQGRAHDVEFEDLEGSPLILDALKAVLDEPFAHGCATAGRWRVVFTLRRS